MATTENRSDNSQASKSAAKPAQRRSSKVAPQGPGRGWHGDSQGHARAGSQSHKNK